MSDRLRSKLVEFIRIFFFKQFYSSLCWVRGKSLTKCPNVSLKVIVTCVRMHFIILIDIGKLQVHILMFSRSLHERYGFM